VFFANVFVAPNELVAGFDPKPDTGLDLELA